MAAAQVPTPDAGGSRRGSYNSPFLGARSSSRPPSPDILVPPPTLDPDGVGRGRSGSPSSRRRDSAGSGPSSRPSSRPGSRPQTPPTLDPDGDQREQKTRRRSFLSGVPKVQKTYPERGPRVPVWVAGYRDKPPYDISPLVNGGPVPELWDEGGDTFIHLFPANAGRAASFRVKSSIYVSSSKLMQLSGLARYHRIASLESADLSPTATESQSFDNVRTKKATEHSSSGSSRHTRTDDSTDDPPRRITLYLPISLTQQTLQGADVTDNEDIDALLAVRNFFAFLMGQSLVATERRPTLFSIFKNISYFLQAYDFTNLDGTTYGEVAEASFNSYVDELGLDDVRSSREKTVEALVLGEKMRSASLYNEAFVHAVGKYDDIQVFANQSGPSSKINLISHVTSSRLERASIDLVQREVSINTRLSDFDFPSVLAGVLSSKTVDERKHIQFDAWKNSFLATRRHVLGYYKERYGSWPPKASSKKNDMTVSGLNRLVLKALYTDFAEMYDLYVDRTSLTTRRMGQADTTEEGDGGSEEPVARILRRVFDEYDRSSPPVQPPVPFDTPLLPNLSAISSDPNVKLDAQARSRKLVDEEIGLLLHSSTNADVLAVAQQGKSHFLHHMRAFERRQARNCNVTELVDLRAGMWIFMYAVLQSLPMLVVDAPGLKWHEGVEYFLCQVPRSGVPWAKASSDGTSGSKAGMNWYGVSGGQGFVHLPSHLVEHGVEGVYRRSHCWLMAKKWVEALPESPIAQEIITGSREQPPSHRHTSSLSIPPSMPERTGAITSRSDRWSRSDAGSRASSRPGSRPVTPNPAGSDRGSDRGRQASRSRQSSSVGLGLEALPLPPGVKPDRSPSRERQLTPNPQQRLSQDASSKASGKTFDDILGGMEQQQQQPQQPSSKRSSKWGFGI